MGTEGLDKSKQSEENEVVTNITATTSTVTSSHTTLGSVTSIGPHLNHEGKYVKNQIFAVKQ